MVKIKVSLDALLRNFQKELGVGALYQRQRVQISVDVSFSGTHTHTFYKIANSMPKE